MSACTDAALADIRFKRNFAPNGDRRPLPCSIRSFLWPMLSIGSPSVITLIGPVAYCGRWKLGRPCLSYRYKLQIIVEFRNQRAEGVASHGSPGKDRCSFFWSPSRVNSCSVAILRFSSFSSVLRRLCFPLLLSSPVQSFFSPPSCFHPSLLLSRRAREVDGKERD